MLKAAIEKIQEMSKPMIQNVEGRVFAISAESIDEIRPTLDRPSTLSLNSLDALVKMVKTEALKKYRAPVSPSPTIKRCFVFPNRTMQMDGLNGSTTIQPMPLTYLVGKPGRSFPLRRP